MLTPLILALVALMATQRRGKERDRFGRPLPTRQVSQSNPGRPKILRPCKCPTHQHRAGCHHANTNGPTRGFVDADKRRRLRQARRAAKAERARVARVAEVNAMNLGPWVPALIASRTMKGVILSRQGDTCEVCKVSTRYLLSMADITSGHEPARVVCSGCSLGLD